MFLVSQVEFQLSLFFTPSPLSPFDFLELLFVSIILHRICCIIVSFIRSSSLFYLLFFSFHNFLLVFIILHQIFYTFIYSQYQLFVLHFSFAFFFSFSILAILHYTFTFFALQFSSFFLSIHDTNLLCDNAHAKILLYVFRYSYFIFLLIFSRFCHFASILPSPY